MKLKTWEQFLEEWVGSDPENTGCYTEDDVYCFWQSHCQDYENDEILNGGRA